MLGPVSDAFWYVDGIITDFGRRIYFSPTSSNKDKLILATLAGVAGVSAFKLWRRSRRNKRELRADLAAALALVEELQESLDAKEEELQKMEEGEEVKEVRVFVEGAFDMMHYGHMNAFRQARARGTYLVAGINSSQSIMECKGSSPLNTDEERIAAVSACKWVDEVIPRSPYVMTDEYLSWVMKEYNIDYVVHGDDPCLVNGRDVYANVKAMGKYRSIPRTEGISTTDVVGRILLQIRARAERCEQTKTIDGPNHAVNLVSRSRKRASSRDAYDGDDKAFMLERPSQFLTTGRMVRLFSAGHKDPLPGQTVVYVDGGFDLFHTGHIEFLQKARALGDYLIVGLYNDAVINATHGDKLPIMNLNERVLSVLGCRYVDDVLIDAPYTLNQPMIQSLNVSIVGVGGPLEDVDKKRYAVPFDMGIVSCIEKSPANVSVGEILRRVHVNQDRFKAKFEKKNKAEAEYYQKRYNGEGEAAPTK